MSKETKTFWLMNSLTLLNIALVFHLVGLVLIAGSTFLDFVMTSRFWKKYSENRHDALIMRESSRVFPTVARVGIALLVLSGVAMMTVMHGAYGQQIWMRIKIGLVVLIILNILIAGRRNANHHSEPESIRSATRFYHISQLVLFLVIFILSVFKFN